MVDLTSILQATDCLYLGCRLVVQDSLDETVIWHQNAGSRERPNSLTYKKKLSEGQRGPLRGSPTGSTCIIAMTTGSTTAGSSLGCSIAPGNAAAPMP